jgi:hypothetical protein
MNNLYLKLKTMPSVPLYKRTPEMTDKLLKYAEDNMILIGQIPEMI